ncbi:hypothetical protein HELRODRAFT_111764 [Helobdella robusta]|uniref:Glycosyl transferase family 25 domain-containing protein n=1 Tax=Helobdella robusta TaxID=6412 RepID=T1EFE2_HELRO|nr:hypothetical protein HELRODRAFT_111764 [Helobdella robusta]ESO04768.1 hypothetical protein HELRODRAFT_111764 [Helobdella robusta]
MSDLNCFLEKIKVLPHQKSQANSKAVGLFFTSSIFIIISLILIGLLPTTCQSAEEIWPASSTAPSVMIAILLRNKAHTLPWFLHYLEKLDYPKNRIRLWLEIDHNVDNSVSMMKKWLGRVQSQYNKVDFVDDDSEINYPDAYGPYHWSKKRVSNILRLRQEALNSARNTWTDFLLFVDADNFLLNDQVLKELMRHDKPIISPMMNVTASDYYSNFWGDVAPNGYYKRSDDYEDILHKVKTGAFQVPVVHSTMLIQTRLQITNSLAYDPPPPNYEGPIDDIIIFAFSARYHKVPMYILNENFYGMMLIPLGDEDTIEDEKEQFLHMKLQAIVDDVTLEKLPYLDAPARPPDKLGFDEIFMINLVRRPERRDKMIRCFKELGINATIFDAVDGKQLNDSFLNSWNVKVLKSYADPYHGTRTLTMGEIGCFLSHYFIWLQVVNRNLSKVIIFEDDVRFSRDFRGKLKAVMSDIDKMEIPWDLLYLGRKKLFEDGEPFVGDSETLVWPLYSYWTIGYALSYAGAFKLVHEDPLPKMVPVDEYLPIMFDNHPREDWQEHFENRNLVALSTFPLLIEPTLYTGEPGYFTDTEDSPTVDVVVPEVGPNAPFDTNHPDSNENDSNNNNQCANMDKLKGDMDWIDDVRQSLESKNEL